MAVVEVPASGVPTPAAARTASPDVRVLDAGLRCIARWGMAKTSLDDVAREAGVSRATVYRAFPGGKDALMEQLARREIAVLHSEVTRRLADARSLEDVLVAGVHEAGRRVVEHRALQVLLAYEPELILPHVSFAGMDQLLSVASGLLAPWLASWLPPEPARRTAEWLVRIVISYSTCPSDHLDLCDERSVRAFVRTFVLPAIENLVSPQPVAS